MLNQDYDKEKSKLVVTVSGDRIPKARIQELQKELPDYGLANVSLKID